MGVLRDQLNNCLEQKRCNGWNAFFSNEMAKDYFIKLDHSVTNAYATGTCYPAVENIFAAFELAPTDVLVVLLGQDPYHTPGMANGLAFSVYEGSKVPPSLRNMEEALRRDLGQELSSYDLTYWNEQGVFLLNTVLTVGEGSPGSHGGFGWQQFTENALCFLADVSPRPIAFLLWGAHAQRYEGLIKKAFHKCPVLIHKSVHPSPLSAYRGFLDSKPYSTVNAFLEQNHDRPIQWGKEVEK